MRAITVYGNNGHRYTTKSAAWRAARNAVGRSYDVDVCDLYTRFEGEIVISTDMIAVEPYDGGWCWIYTYDLGEVTVKCWVNGEYVPARYADVAHWLNCYTPPAETPTPAQEIARRVSEYLHDRDNAESDEKRMQIHDDTMPELLAASREADVCLSDVFAVCRAVDDTFISNNSHYIAEAVVRAEPYGLACGALRARLAMLLPRCGVSPDEYLRVVKESLSQETA